MSLQTSRILKQLIASQRLIKPQTFINSRQCRTFTTTSSTSTPPPPVIERQAVGVSSSNASNDANQKKLNRVYYLSLAIFSFLILDYLQSSVAAGASLYNAEEMRQLHKQIVSGATNSSSMNNNNEALRADILALAETHNRHYETLTKEIEQLRSQLGSQPSVKPHDHHTTWRTSVESLLSDPTKPPRQS